MTTFARGPTDELARWLSFLLGLWLIASAYAWPHAALVQTNTWASGLLIALFALLAMFEPAVRFVNAALGLWVAVSTVLVFAADTRTSWNNIIVGLVVVAASFVPSKKRTFTDVRREVHA